MYEKQITAPESEPVTVEELCHFARLDVPPMDDGASPPGPDMERVFIESCITAAREHVEQLTKTSMLSQRWLLSFDTFPGQEDRFRHGGFQGFLLPGIYYPYLGRRAHKESIEFLRRPVTNEEGGEISLTYLDLTGTEQVFDPSNYIFFADKLTLLPGKAWPIAATLSDAVRLEYSSGYGTVASAVPQRLKKAVMYLAAHFYTVRDIIATELTKEVSLTLSAILGPFMTFRVPR